MDRGAVQELEIFPGIIVKGARANAHSEIERCASRAHRVVDAAAGEADSRYLEPDLLQRGLDDRVLLLVGRAARPVVDRDWACGITGGPVRQVHCRCVHMSAWVDVWG